MRASAPTRIDLAGGWTDVEAFSSLFTGEVVAFAVCFPCYAEVTRTGDGRLIGTYESSTPVGSGLGTTGAVNVAFMAALDGGQSTPHVIAERAFHFETLLGNAGGRQDQYMAALGGFKHLTFQGSLVTSRELQVSSNTRNWLKDRLFLYNCGTQHDSGSVHDPVWNNFRAGDQTVCAALQSLKAAARKMAVGLESDDHRMISQALRSVCQSADRIDPRINEPFKGVCLPLFEQGHISGWKVVGAGAGGCAVLLVNSGSDQEVDSACQLAGWERMAWDYNDVGVLVDSCEKC
mmetsp:Transcript_13447/g.54294  ORF Transcript_13447/g.54294 Transcript_13447/m.54294 type:complete len:291 (+) Transcript_13447:237-1109(+)